MRSTVCFAAHARDRDGGLYHVHLHRESVHNVLRGVFLSARVQHHGHADPAAGGCVGGSEK